MVISSGTYAYFSNSAVSTNNVFASGTLDLKLANGSDTFADTVTSSFGNASLYPNSCLAPTTLNLKNTGTVAGNHLDILATNSNAAFAAFLRLKTLTLDGIDVPLNDSNGNGFKDMQDLAVAGIVNKPLVDFIVHPFSIEVCLDQSAGNPQQGQTNTVEFMILLDQGPHS